MEKHFLRIYFRCFAKKQKTLFIELTDFDYYLLKELHFNTI